MKNQIAASKRKLRFFGLNFYNAYSGDYQRMRAKGRQVAEKRRRCEQRKCRAKQQD